MKDCVLMLERLSVMTLERAGRDKNYQIHKVKVINKTGTFSL